jgi:hypothetical protein
MDVTLAIGHAGERAGEEFEGALARLLGCVHLADVENMEQTAREGDDEAVADSIHEVYAFWERVRGLLLRGGGTGVPETDRAIPGPGNDGVCKERDEGRKRKTSEVTGKTGGRGQRTR